jgi:3-(3-hydroxy-phenyl)propionate hydroxylase
MPPFGGQGMNSGLRDAHNLCWKIALVLQGQARSHLLETYHEERYPHVAQMILFSSLLGKIIMPTHRSIALLRDIFFRGLNVLPPTREALTEMRIKPQPKYTHGFLLPTSSKDNKALRGMLLPQPVVRTQEGEHLLLDDLLGNGFALLRLQEKPSEAFAPLKSALWEQLQVRFVCVQPSSIEGDLHSFFRDQHERCILVRPDRYVFGVFRVSEGDNVAGQVYSMLQHSWPG